MSADALLDRLDAVRQVAACRWRARCPAHNGRNRDVLSIGETNDGTVLVKCFAGCSASDVVAAVGLELTDLFPKVDWQQTGTHHHHHPRRPRVDWPAMVLALERDALLVKIVLAAINRREPIDDVDAEACMAAASRIANLIVEARHG